LYQILSDVKWAPTGATSPLLTRAGFSHGFVGRGQPPPNNLHHVKQVHGTCLVEANSDFNSSLASSGTEGDGIWTKTDGMAVAVKTADCLPVLIGDPIGRMVMSVHAGWRGLCSGILGQAIQVFRTLGGHPEQLLVAVGPAASRERYEVGQEVIAALFDGNIALNKAQAALAITKGRDDRWHLDLKVAAVFDLINHGLRPDHIEVIQACTISEAAWHSFRREGKGCGSNWSWIAMGQGELRSIQDVR
jgi:YfiH family protein